LVLGKWVFTKSKTFHKGCLSPFPGFLSCHEIIFSVLAPALMLSGWAVLMLFDLSASKTVSQINHFINMRPSSSLRYF
jgi:hypothetical protein